MITASCSTQTEYSIQQLYYKSPRKAWEPIIATGIFKKKDAESQTIETGINQKLKQVFKLKIKNHDKSKDSESQTYAFPVLMGLYQHMIDQKASKINGKVEHISNKELTDPITLSCSHIFNKKTIENIESARHFMHERNVEPLEDYPKIPCPACNRLLNAKEYI